MSKKTALKTLIEELLYHLAYDDDLTIESTVILQNVIEKCKIKLELEREQIIDAYGHGQNNGYMYAHQKAITITKENYYSQTYGGNNE